MTSEGLSNWVAKRVDIVNQALRNAKLPYAFGGAIAYGFAGEPRATTDIDVNIFLREDAYAETLRALEGAGIEIDWERHPALIQRDGQVRLPWPPIFIDLFFMTFDYLEAASKRTRTVIYDTVPA